MRKNLSSAFLLAHEFTEEWEEVLQVCSTTKQAKDDYLGLSQAWLWQAQEEAGCPLMRQDLMRIMYIKFWVPLCCEKLPLPLGVFLYDSVVHMGIAPSMHILQQCCNIVGEAHLDTFTPVKINCINNKQSIRLAANLAECNLDFYTARMCVRHRLNYYKEFTKEMKHFKGMNSAQVHLEHWKARCAALLEHLALLERDV